MNQSQHSGITDFFHSDSFEFYEYLNIRRHLPGSRIILRKKTNDKWFDFDATVKLYENDKQDFRLTPSENADAVVSTQYHSGIYLDCYRNSASFRLHYGICTEKGFNHSIKFTFPYDAMLVPGNYSAGLIKRYTTPLVVGLPKYDEYFSNSYDKRILIAKYGIDPGKKSILYIPTWAKESSLANESVSYFLKSVSGRYNVVIKPHHVSLRFEKDKYSGLKQYPGFTVIEHPVVLGELLTIADFCICDALSGAYWESILVGRKPTLGLLYSAPSFRLTNMELRIDAFGAVSRNPGYIAEDFEKALIFHDKNRDRLAAEAGNFVAHTDGSSGKRAAEAIMEFTRRFKKGTGTVHYFKWHIADKWIMRSPAVRSRALNFMRKGANRAKILHRKFLGARNLVDNFRRARGWIYRNSVPGKGIVITSDRPDMAYAEVTGYCIPTLLEWGERELAVKYKDWLVSIQNQDGSWNDSSGNIPYTFDTGQILKGLLALADYYPDLKENISRGCDWVLSRQAESGRVTTPDVSAWDLPGGKIIPEAIHLYALKPLRDAGIKWGIQRYNAAVEKALEYYLADKTLTDFNTLSHFHAYIIEALLDLGRTDMAKMAMSEIARLQRPDGSVPAYRDVNWVCAPGLFQYAIIWYKLGETERGDQAFRYAVKLQNRSGGFHGSYGRGATYFPKRETSWAVKYFLDAYYWKIRSTFNKESGESGKFPETIDENNGELKKVIAFLGDLNGKKVIDVGCGKGRFLRVYKRMFPNGDFHAIDLSDEMLKYCPAGVKKNLGSILNIPYPDSSFDCVYSVETLEHAISIENAISELCRVLKPGGRIIIIDKDKKKLGQLRIENWEQWFIPEQIIQLLDKHGIVASYKLMSNMEYKLPDKLLVAWEGIKRL